MAIIKHNFRLVVEKGREWRGHFLVLFHGRVSIQACLNAQRFTATFIMLRGQVLHSILYDALHAKHFTSQIDPSVYLPHNALKTLLKRRTISNTLPLTEQWGHQCRWLHLQCSLSSPKHFWHIKVLWNCAIPVASLPWMAFSSMVERGGGGSQVAVWDKMDKNFRHRPLKHQLKGYYIIKSCNIHSQLHTTADTK